MKVYKKKRRSCPMCKPNKMGSEPCWTAKDFEKLKRMEKEARDATKE
jgi:hypothetical protein